MFSLEPEPSTSVRGSLSKRRLSRRPLMSYNCLRRQSVPYFSDIWQLICLSVQLESRQMENILLSPYSSTYEASRRAQRSIVHFPVEFHCLPEASFILFTTVTLWSSRKCRSPSLCMCQSKLWHRRGLMKLSGRGLNN